MSSVDRDDEFEAYLRHRSVRRDGRQSPARDLEPPENLDQIVLRTAREAIEAPHQLPLYRAPRWALPVGLAATLLLCLSIALNVSLRPGEHRAVPPPLSVQTAPAVESTPAAARAERSIPEAKVAPTPQAPPPAAAILTAPQAGPGARALEVPGNMSAADSNLASRATRPRQDPQPWLQQIETLRAQGKITQANSEWRRFHAAFPDFPGPPWEVPAGAAK
jgi:hypothetical protein